MKEFLLATLEVLAIAICWGVLILAVGLYVLVLCVLISGQGVAEALTYSRSPITLTRPISGANDEFARSDRRRQT